jgi:hypothetical protein
MEKKRKFKTGQIVYICKKWKAKVIDEEKYSVLLKVTEGVCGRKTCPYCHWGILSYPKNIIYTSK